MSERDAQLRFDDDADEQPQDTIERRFISVVQEMLARPDYLIPLAAAERQFRDHYYGLNSAALLEDLFFDALGNYLRQVRPRTSWIRPNTGQKGWDYAFDGLQISHKVSQSLSDIAALWDATKVGVTHWSFDEPITYVLGKNSPSTSLRLSIGDATPVRARAVADLGSPYLLDGKAVMVVVWPTDGSAGRVLHVCSSRSDSTAIELLPFDVLWGIVAEHVSRGGAANEIDVLVTTARPTDRVLGQLADACRDLVPIEVDVTHRGGVYVLPRDLLTDLEVTSNNRAILIPTETVKACLTSAHAQHLFAPLPLWYWPYAQGRPPDMYSAQRVEYETRFSARRGLD